MNRQGTSGAILPRAFLIVFVASAFLCSGCSGKGEIKGKVTYQGKTVVYGTVTLIDSEGVPHPGVIDPDGNYTIRNLPVGLAKLAVNSPDPKVVHDQVAALQSGRPQRADQAPKKDGANRGNLPDLDPEVKKKWFEIPPKLGDPDNSGLTIEVKSGQNPHDIPLN
jgi:hypothetical protein